MRRRYLETVSVTVHPKLLVEVCVAFFTAIALFVTTIVLLLVEVDVLVVTALLERRGIFLLLDFIVLAADHAQLLLDWCVDLDVDFAEGPRTVVLLLFLRLQF